MTDTSWWLAAGALVLALSGCEREDTPAAGQEQVPEAPRADVVDEAGRVLPPDQAAEGEPIRIYYDLTRYDWYRHGEPLLADGRRYQVEGKPVPLQASTLRRAGEYGGVEYYVRTDEPEPEVVFVPVYEQYWQPFVAAEAAAALAD